MGGTSPRAACRPIGGGLGRRCPIGMHPEGEVRPALGVPEGGAGASVSQGRARRGQRRPVADRHPGRNEACRDGVPAGESVQHPCRAMSW